MQTQLLSYKRDGDKAIEKATSLLKKGEVVAIPTETVYGLAADATNSEAVQKIFEAKGRPSDNPLIVHLASKQQLQNYVLPYLPYVDLLMEAFSPGPITYVLKCKDVLAKEVTAGLDTVGIRFPSHPVGRAVLQASQLPLAAPSANLSGKPSPTEALHVWDDLSGRISAIIDGGASDVGLESTVVDCTGASPVILRQGKVTEADIAQIIPVQDKGKQIKTTEQPRSPGVKYKHYVPEVPLLLVNRPEQLQTVMQAEKAKGHRIGLLLSQDHDHLLKDATRVYHLGDTEAVQAQHLYALLRAMKKAEVDVVIAENVSMHSIGSAVMDRLRRAATRVYD